MALLVSRGRGCMWPSAYILWCTDLTGSVVIGEEQE